MEADIETKQLIIEWFKNNGGKSKGVLGWATLNNPYEPDLYLDVEQIEWKAIQVFIGGCEDREGVRKIDVAYLLNHNFPVEEQYEETIRELTHEVGNEFVIGTGETENLEIWMSYFEDPISNDQKFLEKLEYSAVTAARLTKIASGFRHIPQVRLV